MKQPSLRELAVMTIDEGEEIAGAWITPYIPEVGMYKLLAKKTKDGSYIWVHFIQRLNGNKDIVFRGEAKDKEQLETLLEVANGKLQAIFKVKLQPADADMYTLDGKPAPGKLQ
ncbi:MAG: hypothetical protein QY306_14215 [Anaerolineales bacterium]|nr:MAG: hypothetical protein QY306_14215 [Anaerolineales bacterium]